MSNIPYTHYNIYYIVGRKILCTLLVGALLLLCGSTARAGVKVTGSVYGGGKSADVGGDTEVNMTDGEVSQSVFGGGEGQTTTVVGDVKVYIGKKDGSTYTGSGNVKGNVYGGSALGAVNATKGDGGTLSATEGKTTQVNIYQGTVEGSVFGGGLGQLASGTPDEPGYEAAIAAQNFGNTTVTLENSDNAKALVQTAVYGGANVNGVLRSDAEVTISGGTVGTTREGNTVKDVVFGGGQGQPTLVNGNVTVNVGTKSGDATPVYGGTAMIHGNVYGGSALGNTNAAKNTGADAETNPLTFYTTGEGKKATAVNLYGGTIDGNVFGGGLGRKAVAGAEAVGTEGESGYVPAVEAVAGVESFVGGDVTVVLDGAKLVCSYTGEGENRMPLTGQVFGANNWNGTPKGHVKVHVKRTVDSAKDTKVARDNRTTYDVAAVYGGGNQADYIPTNAILDTSVEGNKALVEKATAEVIIEGCDLTSIEYVYGGGNAAAVPATDVTVTGSYIIHYMFGGGNGKSTNTFVNPGANIGIYNNSGTPANYGTGKAETKLVGGHIHYIFGGSNTKGNVRGGTAITMPDASAYSGYDCCAERDVKEIYGAGNEAEQDGNVTLILGCVKNMDYVYGGARNAHVNGGVDLVVTSGSFKGVFGGNNIAGTIQGPITVTIEETGCDPLEIDALYLGGNQAAYSVYGYKKDVDGTLVARTSLTDGTAVNPPATNYSETQLYRDPILNVVSCTRIGKTSGEDLGGMFGGGLGAGAVMYGSPTVNVNMIAGKYAERIDRNDTPGADNDKNALGDISNVYGGGQEANVVGDTRVNICTESTVKVRSDMGASIPESNQEEKAVQGARITGNVFGAGKGKPDDANSALVTGSTTMQIAGGSVFKSVYGGGELSQVGGDTHVNVSGGIIGTAGQGEATYGNVYGGGLGNSSDTKFGLVQGNTNIAVTGGKVLHNIYGGGAYGSVGTYSYDEGTGATICANNTGDATITIAGGTIGTDGKENGMVFGSSRGDVAKPTGEPARDPNDYLAWVNNTHVTIGLSEADFETQKANEPYKSYGTYESYKTTGAPHVKGSVYGSGENGHTYKNTEVIIHSGTIGITDTSIDGGASYALRGNVYGGGCGTDQYDSNNDGTPDTYNPWSGIVQRNATVLIDGGQVVHNVYGAGAMGSVEGGTSVTIAGGTVGVDGTDNGFVYAAAKGDEALAEGSQAHVGTTELKISGGTVWGSAFGGGQAGIVKKAVTVSLTGGEVKHDVYGGGALARTNTQYDGTNETYKTYVTNVTLAGATIAGDLYGGGLGSNTVAADVKGPVTVAVSSGSADRVFGCNNVNGAPQSTVTVNVIGGTIGNAYGGGNQATYSYTNAVSPQNLQVNISGGTIGNVFGGGLSAEVAGGIDVNITGGTVTNDVYGGGALANTNTANWDFSNTTKESYYLVSGLKAGTSSVDGLYYKPYIHATGTAVAGTTYYELKEGVYSTVSVNEGSDVSAYYTRSENYTPASGTAEKNVWYYRQVKDGDWAAGMNEGGETTYKTNVTLRGGIVGNVYGGALGQHAEGAEDAIKPIVYGDIDIKVNEEIEGEYGTARFHRETEPHTYEGTFMDANDVEQTKTVDGKVFTKGCVYGANNKEGTPKGNIQVTVWRTIPESGNPSDRAYLTYEIQNVYGGGNLADYEPGEGKSTHVDIHGCDRTSIQFVFGGGNAASVPETNVTIWGCYEIETVFGGGNGSEPFYDRSASKWVQSPGAMVGTSNVTLKGGYLHSAFGGSYERGTVGTVHLDKSGTDGECDLKVTDVFGGGKDADVDFVNITISDCAGLDALVSDGQNPDHIKNVYAGSYNARIFGDVKMTVTSGNFTNVFGGNHTSGFINGTITINIEETERCKPVIIENLYGGGNYAAYPGPGANYATPKITVNVKAATRIGNIYGGCNHADVTGDTEVNINMIKGWWAGKTYVGEDSSLKIPDAIGVIGNVYGGGNEGKVVGNTVVNIGTAKEIALESVPQKETEDESSSIPSHMTPKRIDEGKYCYDVLGANIKGDVFGGCNLDDVTGNTTVNICTADYSGTTGYERVSIGGSVYGGGSRGDVLGNTSVTMSGGNRPEVDGAYVFDGVYGGGLRGSVGTVTSRVLPDGHPTHAGCLGGKPDAYADGTGKCTVVVSGGQVGPVEVALANGGMKNKARYFKATGERNGPVDYGFVFGAGRGEVEDPYSDPDVDFHTYVKETDVTIKNTYAAGYESAADSISHTTAKPLIMASVYGGGENGRVRGNTSVKIYGGQIGCGVGSVTGTGTTADPYVAQRYEESQFIDPLGTTVTDGDTLAECAHWDYGKVKNGIKEYLPYDPLYFEPLLDEDDGDDENNEADEEGADGHTYYGNVFGGGSGYYPYEKANKGEKKHDWLRSAGWVEGNTRVVITGGHILTNVYGGNETTDVGGKCTITMSGGTIGVPRTLAQIAKHPVTCYLFGAGKGDQRTHFNTWTNVNETEVNVTGGIIYGSVFGGGEDGHVLGNTKVNIGGMAKIGTWGTSYVDGNVFGGGRGFSGEALTAGSIGGNARVNISGGTMLGSVYGGGRLASVGIGFTEPDDPSYGQLTDDKADEQHGHVTVSITGGTIGKAGATGEGAKYSGNVFGGSMGRIGLLDGKPNPLWPKLAVAKLTEVNIGTEKDATEGPLIIGSVYGGGEYGVVRNRTTVTVYSGTINGNVFGSGYGSEDNKTATTIVAGGYSSIPSKFYTFTPMQWAGCVSGNTYVNIKGGWVKRNVYGGGNLASVGLINYNVIEKAGGEFTYNDNGVERKLSYANIVKHVDLTKEFALSWPYKYEYIAAAPTDLPAVGGGQNNVGGRATVTITGGRIGITGKDYMGSDTSLTEDEKKELREDNGDVYGGGKGGVGDRYDYAFCANVKEAVVTVNYKSSTAAPGNYVTGVSVSSKGTAPDCIAGSVYGGGENGHVYKDTKVTLASGLIGHALYGGGKGKDKYNTKLKNWKDKGATEYDAEVYSITSGKVYGNTEVEMTGGYVMRNIYGGGNMASVGKGNYAGGADDYSKFGNMCGYGEATEGNLWDKSNANSIAFLESGKATITITGGEVGTATGEKDGLPTGNVYGGSRGEAAPNIFNQPVHDYNPTFHVGNINEAKITIGTEGGDNSAPRIYGSVYGGGQDGHMRRDAKVTVFSGEIGNAYNDANKTAVGTSDLNNLQWKLRGNVYGSGSGIGQFVFDYDGDHYTYTDKNGNRKYDPGEPVDTYSFDSDGDGVEETHTDVGLSFLAGCVARFSEVDIRGGIIHRNVYGGGSVAGTGMPKFYGQNYEPYKKGDTDTQGKQSQNTVSISGGTIGQEGYGGNVFGASRGEAELVAGENPMFATSIWTEVKISGGTIYNNVYGGGELGSVKMDTKVNLTGGDILHDAYGGGKGIKTADGTGEVEANIGGNATVLLNEGVIGKGDKGCSVGRIFGCNDMNGSPKGHVLVHVYATRHRSKFTNGDKFAKYDNIDNYTISSYAGLTTIAQAVGADVKKYTDVLTDGSASEETKERALSEMRDSISLKKYDVQAVYGGGNLASYFPTDAFSDNEATKATAFAEVIIDGCEVTSIKQVYGNGNAAPTPASKLYVYGCYEIDELFGGGNGYDNYQLSDGKWYENPGANVGYKNYAHYVKVGETGYDEDTHGKGTEAKPYKAIENDNASNKEYRIANYSYGTGEAHTEVYGGRIHNAYGGSNIKGNIRILAMSSYESATDCPSEIDHTYGGGNKALIDGQAQMLVKCVDYMAKVFGGNTNADVNNDIVLTITNGVYGKVIGGNDQGGNVSGSITVNIIESGCKPIIIDELYGCGYEANYSIYGYNTDRSPRTKEEFEKACDTALDGVDKNDQTAVNNALIKAGLYGFPKADPRVNIISATKIGDVYGGGYKAVVIGNPTVNVNMEEGMVTSKYVTENPTAFSDGKHTLTTNYTENSEAKTRYDDYVVIGTVKEEGVNKGNAKLKIGTIGNIYGGGSEADVIGNTTVEIGTGSWYNPETHVTEDIVRKEAFIVGNVYGGGRMGHVGNFTFDADGSNSIPDGKPTSCVEGTGIARIVIKNGEIGPDDMKMYHVDGGNIPADDMPDDFGHVFGGGKGTNLPANDNDAYCDGTEVIIDGTAWVKGCVFGGGENGHVLHDAGVKIGGDCQIGNGHILRKDGSGNILVDRGVNRRYTDAEWEAGHLFVEGDPDIDASAPEEVALRAAASGMFTSSLPECASWPFGEDTDDDGKNDTWSSYDIFEGASGYNSKGGKRVASSGRTFYGSVFGGGSGFFPYEPGEWNDNAGKVEGNSRVEVTGGHILTSLYGGCEMSSMGGDTHVTMTGGTLGVPRTLSEIAAHPVTCYLFGGGKGDQRVYFNRSTDVMNAYVDVLGGTVYGSVFGGGEDGHVMRNVYMNIGNDDGTGPKIGTWGTSYVEGNVFGGGRGFSGDAYTAGNVSGSVTLKIKGGEMLGSVYGGGRLGSVGYGLYLEGEEGFYGTMRPDNYDRDGTTSIPGFKRGYVDMEITGGTIGNTNEFKYIAPGVTGDALAAATANMPYTELDADNRLLHTKGGNVYAGGMGRYYKLDGVTPISTYDGGGNLTSAIDWKKLGNVKSTNLTIGGDAWIMGNVYGGGELGAVTPYKNDENVEGGSTTITITGGTIGTEITSSAPPQKETIPVPAEDISDVKYTFGSVYGGGYGTEDKLRSDAPTAAEAMLWNNDVENLGAFVTESTYISMSGGHVRASVFGGGEVAAVGGSTHVSISGGKIGRDEVKPKSDPDDPGYDPGYVLFGGATMGNVYGGGKGTNLNPLVGVVRTNTNVSISAGTVEGEPFIYHNVYGGGALGSVGVFHPNNPAAGDPDYVPVGVPYGWTNPDYSVTDQNGIAKVTITGGTIGISGRDNGMVNGSSRGDVAVPELSSVFGIQTMKDPYDRFAYVNKSYVTIGTEGSATGPVIKGSVYGGGENGHNNNDATVTMYSGTVGIQEGEDWFDYGNPDINKKAMITRGNIYGAGCGTDTYTDPDDGKKKNNPWSGSVSGDTNVNIHGGLVTHNVYGGGSMGSVGVITEDLDFKTNKDKFKLSWPCIFTYKPDIHGSNGHSTVNIYGGRIGTTGSDNGDVFGGARGKAGDATLEVMHPGSVKTATVNISFEPSVDAVKAVMEGEEAKIRIDLKDGDEKLVNAIAGSVYGGGEDGLVYENTSVTMTNGLVGHSIYGGGKGKGTYTRKLKRIVGGEEYEADTYSIHSGKVYGNTSVAMADGLVLRNVYGGGNLGSVGKGNYSGGKDDYSTSGYGETLTGNLWDGVSDDSKAFLGSGKTSVTITGGTVGYIDSEHPEASYKDGLPYGNVFGGCRGEAAPVVPEDETPRYLTCPAFFTGYVNETDVNIGASTTESGPTILGTVYGGGEDGHVRRSTHIKVYGGTIGLDFTEANQARVGSTDINAPGWLYRGNVYGAGSGIGEYAFDFDGNGKTDDVISIDGQNYSETGFSQSSGSVTHFTRVDVLGGTVYRNVAGGGSLASVGPPKITTQRDYAAMIAATDYSNPSVWGTRSLNLVNIGGLKPEGESSYRTVNIGSQAGVAARYGGNVFGGSRGEPSVGSGYASSIWTLVNVGHGSFIHGNVFGGGNAGEVLKDTKVVVGEE